MRRKESKHSTNIPNKTDRNEFRLMARVSKKNRLRRRSRESSRKIRFHRTFVWKTLESKERKGDQDRSIKRRDLENRECPEIMEVRNFECVTSEKLKNPSFLNFCVSGEFWNPVEFGFWHVDWAGIGPGFVGLGAYGPLHSLRAEKVWVIWPAPYLN